MRSFDMYAVCADLAQHRVKARYIFFVTPHTHILFVNSNFRVYYNCVLAVKMEFLMIIRLYARLLSVRLISSKQVFTTDFTFLFVRALIPVSYLWTKIVIFCSRFTYIANYK